MATLYHSISYDNESTGSQANADSQFLHQQCHRSVFTVGRRVVVIALLPQIQWTCI